MLSCVFLILITVIACLSSIFSAAAAPPPFSIVPDTRSLVPTVIIEGIENGELWGQTRGNMRLFLGQTQVMPDGSGAFRVPAGMLLRDVRVIAAPDGMHFIASKKGKRFYPVHSKQAEALAPKNRVYFKTENEARSAGYR